MNIFNDPNISFSARGLYFCLKTLVDSNEYSFEKLLSMSKNGRNSTYKTINELINAGYIARKREKVKNGIYGKTTYVFLKD